MQISLLSFLLVFFCASICTAQTPIINGISYSGSGCPAGTASVSIVGSSFAIDFDSLDAIIGPPYPPYTVLVGCNLVVNLSLPVGFAITVDSVNYLGSTTLQTGISAVIFSALYFNFPFFCIGTAGYTGPLIDFPITAVAVPCYLPVYSGCAPWTLLYYDLIVELIADGTAVADQSQGILTIGEDTGSFRTLPNLSWQQCQGSS